jgi:hypothetical protein
LKLVLGFYLRSVASYSACPWSCLISLFVSCLDQRDPQYGHEILKLNPPLLYPDFLVALAYFFFFFEGASSVWAFYLSRTLPWATPSPIHLLLEISNGLQLLL